MAAAIDLANMALSYLGEDFLTPTDLAAPTTPTAQLVALHLNLTLDEVAGEHDWDFALVWSGSLAVLAGVSSPDYPFYFALPDGTGPDPYCLVVRATDHDEFREPWVVHGRRIGLAVSNTVRLLYRSRQLDTTAWAAPAIVAASYRLANKLAYAITESQSVASDMWKLYQAELQRARTTDSMQQPARMALSRTLLDVRLE